MMREEATERLRLILEEATADEDAVCYVTSDDADALDMAIKSLEKQKAISELQPPTDNWETYADRLYDLAYLSGYNDGLIAKERKSADADNKPKLTH